MARWLVLMVGLLGTDALAVEPLGEAWDYVSAMRKVAGKFQGKEGTVIHVGGSMTIANPYGTWPRSGKGRTDADLAILKWMHTGANDKTDGWWLCRTEVVPYRAHTSESGLTSHMLLAGGKRGLPNLAKILETHRPQIVTFEVGIYDVEENVPLEIFQKNMAQGLDQVLAAGAIPILNTIPPFQAQLKRCEAFNEALRNLAKERGIPVLDLEREIYLRRPKDWFGNLMKRIHLTAGEAGVSPSAEPTADNLAKSGYLLRGYLTVQKIAEVKRKIIDRDLESRLRELDPNVIVRGKNRVAPMAGMMGRYSEARIRDAVRADSAAWEKVQTKQDWEKFRDVRIQALRDSLGTWPAPSKDLTVQLKGRHEGDGYIVDNLIYPSRHGLFVTANLYRPAKPAESMPVMVIVNSHQQPKHVGIRQDMAMTWARAGCLVLVPDHLGHGERRQHPFGPENPLDYHGRYDLAVQLHLAGESLMGWFVWDLMRGIDVLLSQKGADAKRVILISEPAGGGDVAAVTAALDPRVTCAMVNNFGGPEPETAYPLPPDAEQSFDFAGGGSWESTRNLRLSVRDGFLPWTIIASMAPRKLIYYHEFYWDKENDPVWRRLKKVYGFYDSPLSLEGAAGRGFVVGSAPENTHWLALSRELVYPILEKWFAIPNPGQEYQNRRPLSELECFTPEVAKTQKPLHQQLGHSIDESLSRIRKDLATTPVPHRRERMATQFKTLLGKVEPTAAPIVRGIPDPPESLGDVTLHRIHLQTEPGIVVPALLLIPKGADKRPLVLAVAQEGKSAFLQNRSGMIAEMLRGGAAVCLVDVRGTGETDPGGSRSRSGAATTVTASEWMLGDSPLAGRLRDLRSVLRHISKEFAQIDTQRVALWGDSFTQPVAGEVNRSVPHTSDKRPAVAEPMGPMIAMLLSLYEPVEAVYTQGGLRDIRSAFDSPFPYLPMDVVVPGILQVCDLPDVAHAIPKLRQDALVDAGNRRVTEPGGNAAAWILQNLKR